jgi:hypothetical protein
VIRLSAAEMRIVMNFVGTLHGLTLAEAMANADIDARQYGLSAAAKRELGHRIRIHFAERARAAGGPVVAKVF